MSNVVFFDGVGGQLNIADNASLRVTTEFTVSMKFKFVQNYQYQKYLISRGAVGYYAIILGYVPAPGRVVEFLISAAAGDDLRPGSQITIPDIAWHHLTYAYSNTGTSWKGFLDGQRIFNLTKTTTLSNAVAGLSLGSAGGAGFTNIIISESQLYNRQLSDSEVLYNFMHPGNPIKRGIQLNLTQDSIQGAQWLDLSGNNNHGTYVGGAVPQVANLLAGR